MTTEKRRFPRVHSEMKIRYRLLRSADLSFVDDEAVSRDMSLGGLALAISHPLVKDDMLKIEVVDGEAQGLRAYAEVAWASESSAGLRFMGILDTDRERLQELVSQHLGQSPF